jgi:hypothetical protein
MRLTKRGLFRRLAGIDRPARQADLAGMMREIVPAHGQGQDQSAVALI